MPTRTNPQRLLGNWDRGVALDLHTVSSELLHGRSFNTQRTEVGELLYQVKYRHNYESVSELVQVACEFIRNNKEYRDVRAIIPVPPSDVTRPLQPVQEVAMRIGSILSIPVLLDYVRKARRTMALKNIDDVASRRVQLAGAFKVEDLSLAGKSVLLFDDLIRSGETLREITRVLKEQGRVATVYVLTLTKTRTKR